MAQNAIEATEVHAAGWQPAMMEASPSQEQVKSEPEPTIDDPDYDPPSSGMPPPDEEENDPDFPGPSEPDPNADDPDYDPPSSGTPPPDEEDTEPDFPGPSV